MSTGNEGMEGLYTTDILILAGLSPFKEAVGTSHMNDNRQMSVSRKRLVDFMSMVT
jgi:hypothetical protein